MAWQSDRKLWVVVFRRELMRHVPGGKVQKANQADNKTA
jgi:hypothetical protein